MAASLGAAAAVLALGLSAARAQDMPGMAMPSAPPPASAAAPMAGMSMSAPPAAPDMPGAAMAAMDMGGMVGDLGGYPMARDASGTAWQPDSSPMEEIHARPGGWALMAHGYAALVYDDQGGRRGDDKTFSESMVMGMAQRSLAGGTLTLRAMGSLDPLMGPRGYPLLLGTGETADGRTPLVDRQHPHDLAMELAGVYSRPLARGVSGFLYLGWPGEPALGPATFMHRWAGMANPEAPIGHHWLDSTHVTFGVATAGLVWRGWKLEASDFTGREPNQHRYDFDHPRFDSWAVRLSWNPAPDWSLQVSRGDLHSPEQLEPLANQTRTTASATYNRPLKLGNWQTTFAWGRDEDRARGVLGAASSTTTDAFLLESAASRGPYTLFGRAERVGKDELFADDPANPLAGRTFDVGKLSVGAFYTLPVARAFALDFGALVSRYDLPGALDAAYGSDPTSFMLFSRVKLR